MHDVKEDMIDFNRVLSVINCPTNLNTVTSFKRCKSEAHL